MFKKKLCITKMYNSHKKKKKKRNNNIYLVKQYIVFKKPVCRKLFGMVLVQLVSRSCRRPCGI